MTMLIGKLQSASVYFIKFQALFQLGCQAEPCSGGQFQFSFKYHVKVNSSLRNVLEYLAKSNIAMRIYIYIYEQPVFYFIFRHLQTVVLCFWIILCV